MNAEYGRFEMQQHEQNAPPRQEDRRRLRDVRISTSTAGRVVFLYRETIPLPDLDDHGTDLVALEEGVGGVDRGNNDSDDDIPDLEEMSSMEQVD